MALPETDVARVRRWIEARNEELPPRANDLVRFEMDVDARAITIVECRPPWRPDLGPEWTRFPVARMRYTLARQEWALYWRDRHEKFHEYDEIGPTPRIDLLLAEIDEDPIGIFWG